MASMKFQHCRFVDFLNSKALIFDINNFFTLFKGDWYFAKQDCTSRGMELVSIESLEEQQAIEAEISKSIWYIFFLTLIYKTI